MIWAPISLILLATIFVGSLVIGKKILNLFLKNNSVEAPIIQPASLALGLALLGFLVLTAGEFRILTTQSLWAIWAIYAAAAMINFQKAFFQIKNAALHHFSIGEKIASGLLLALFFFNAYRPEIFFDTLVYHFGLPELFLQNASTKPLPWNFFSAIPLWMEMINTLTLAIGGEPLMKMAVAMTGLIAPWGIYAWLAQTGKPREGFWAALLFLTTPIISRNLFNCLNEPALAGFLILALYFALSDRKLSSIIEDSSGEPRTPNPEPHFSNSRYFLAGLFGGLCFSIKYIGGLWCMVLLVVISLETLFNFYKTIPAQAGIPKRKFFSDWTPVFAKVARICFIFSSGVLITSLPWMLRSYLALGDPIYPYLSLWLNKYPNPEGWAHFTWEVQHWYPNWPKFLGSFAVILKGSFWDTSSTYFMGPVYLILLAISAQSLWKKENRGLGFFCALGWISGLSQTHYLRYLSPLLAPSILLAFSQLDSLTIKRQSWIKKISVVFVILHLFWMLHSFRRRADQKAIFGITSSAQYRQNKLGYWNSVEWVNKNIPSQERLLILGDTRPYGFKKPLIVSTVHDIHPLSNWANHAQDVNALEQTFKAQKIKYIWHNKTEEQRIAGYAMMRLTSRSQLIWEKFQKSNLEEVYADQSVSISKIKYSQE